MIPRIFHQIWIGDSITLPEPYQKFACGWKKLHPTWEFKIWNLNNLNFDLCRPELLKQATSQAQLADVLRLEILLRYGGVYIDTDFECFRPIDELIANASFFACTENGVYISNAILGSIPNHDVLHRLVHNLPRKIGNAKPNVETGPKYITQVIMGGGFSNNVTIFPTKFFYPFGPDDKALTAVDCPASYGAHHWAKSWRQSRSAKLSAMFRRATMPRA